MQPFAFIPTCNGILTAAAAAAAAQTAQAATTPAVTE